MKATFVYAQPRGDLVKRIAAGEAPNSPLYGQTHLAEFGIQAEVHDPRVRNRDWRSPAVTRVAWYGRELTLPWEIREADAVLTALYWLFPLADRVRGRRVFILNMALCGTLARVNAARRRLLVASMRASAGIVCFAESNREALLERTGLPPERIHTSPFGVDHEFFSPRDDEEEGDFVLAVGFDPGRDYRTFFEAMSALPYKAVIVARPRNLVGLSLPANTVFEPDASFVRLRELYARAKCVVVPTRHESYPYGGDTTGVTSLIEAMSMARPIIISERSTLRDYVVDGESARIVPAEDPAAMKAAIEEVVGDDSLRKSLGQGARRAIEERLTTKHMAERMAGIIRAGLNGG